MIHEFEFYHGAVLTKLASQSSHVKIGGYGDSRAAYIINDSIGLYIKHSTNRLTPWSFSFSREQQNELRNMSQVYDGRLFLALVCGKDGIACLSFSELKLVLDDDHGDHEWIRISRRPREKYAVKGSDGSLKFKVAYTDFPEKIFIN